VGCPRWERIAARSNEQTRSRRSCAWIRDYRDWVDRCENSRGVYSDKSHRWEVLRWNDYDEFCRTTHFEEGQRFERVGQEAWDHGDYEGAIESLENGLSHFQRAQEFANDPSTLRVRCQEVLNRIVQIEVAEQIQQIDDLVDIAENAIDEGDELHFHENSTSARDEYSTAIDALTEAVAVASKVAPDRVQRVEQRRRRVQLRQESLERSESHQSIRNLVISAREYTTAGDRAFRDSDYETALDQYQQAKREYEALSGVFEAFSFNDPVDDQTVCDVCKQQYSKKLNMWEIDLEISLEVCPLCARFGPDGNLPTPRDITAEQRAVVENIESIQDGDVGLVWSSDTPPESIPDTPVTEDTGGPETRELLMQLVGLYQRLGGPPTAEQIDEHTEFGYLEYRAEFGSVANALQEAGFDV